MGIFGRCICPMCNGTIAGNALVCPSCGWVVDQGRLHRHTQQAEHKAADDQMMAEMLSYVFALLRMGPAGWMLLLLLIGTLALAGYCARNATPNYESEETSSKTDSVPGVETPQIVVNAPLDSD